MNLFTPIYEPSSRILLATAHNECDKKISLRYFLITIRWKINNLLINFSPAPRTIVIISGGLWKVCVLRTGEISCRLRRPTVPTRTTARWWWSQRLARARQRTEIDWAAGLPRAAVKLNHPAEFRVKIYRGALSFRSRTMYETSSNFRALFFAVRVHFSHFGDSLFFPLSKFDYASILH